MQESAEGEPSKALQRLQHPRELLLNSCDRLGLDDRNAAKTAVSALHPQSRQPLQSRSWKTEGLFKAELIHSGTYFREVAKIVSRLSEIGHTSDRSTIKTGYSQLNGTKPCSKDLFSHEAKLTPSRRK